MKKVLLILLVTSTLFFQNYSFANNWVYRHYKNNGSCIHRHHKNIDSIYKQQGLKNKCHYGNFYCNSKSFK